MSNPEVADPAKRAFLRLGAEASLGLVAAPFIQEYPQVDLLRAAASWLMHFRERGSERFTSEMILSRRQGWPSRDWAPIFEAKAIKEGLFRLHDDWWPAHVYDLEVQAAGGSSNAQEQATKKAEFIMKNHPGMVNFAGYCPWLAAAQATEDEPEVFEGERLGGAEAPEMIKRLKTGLLIIKHAGDILVETKPTGKNLLTLVRSRFPLVVDLPDRLGAGQWFRCIQGVSEDGEFVRVTNFGFSDVDLSVSKIVSAWRVLSADSDAVLASGIREATSFWRFDVDRRFIDQLVYGR